MSNAQFGYTDKFSSVERFFDYVFNATGGGVTFADITADARDVGTGDVTITAAVANDALYLGMKDAEFHHVRFLVTAAAGANGRTWEASTGPGAWTAFTPQMLRDANQNFISTVTSVMDAIWGVLGGPWVKATVNGKYAYWIRLRATGANSPVVSQIMTRTVIASTEEITLPAANAGGASPSDVWSSQHDTIQVVLGRNDMIDYNDGGVKSITIPPGWYRPENRASTIEGLLGAGYTVTWSETTGYTLTKSAGTFQLLARTGTNKARSALYEMGFDGSTDKTGVLTYTSDYVRKSSGGQYTITAGNRNFQFTDSGARNINLTTGTYSTGSLQAMAKSAMDGSGGGFTDYDVKFDEETLLWSFKRGGGNISIQACTFLDVVGLVVAAAAAVQTGTTQRINTDEWVVFALNANITPDTLVMLNHNLSATSVTKIQQMVGATWTDMQTFTYAADEMYMAVAAPPTNNMYRILITDIDNANGKIQTGTIACFDSGDGFFSTNRNISYGGDHSKNFIEDKSISSGGVIHATMVGAIDTRNHSIFGLNATDKTNLEAMEDAIGTGAPFLFVSNPAASPVDFMWCALTGPISFKEEDSVAALFSANLPLTEFK